ncbi:unnamed protein product [Linum trigynum]|uniref:Uncharacterized protein n=1 Tax=Linum trigynum TaxID=586398 RepID=A0AAV2DHU8_9ROSI
MYWSGSVATGIYIFIQFLKLSPQESAQDPIYHVLLRPEHKRTEERRQQKNKKNSSSSVVRARIAFIVWACLMIAAVIYSVLAVGTPFRMEVWIAHKEESWLSVSLWVLLYICLGSLATCAYMAKQLFQLSSQDPLYLVLVKRNNRASKRTPPSLLNVDHD